MEFSALQLKRPPARPHADHPPLYRRPAIVVLACAVLALQIAGLGKLVTFRPPAR
ncbi:MAG: hypothetical protein JWM61_2399 [Micrococcaceae bacterium]|nr:hypothetical protein [Micrococcaceae bacterium]